MENQSFCEVVSSTLRHFENRWKVSIVVFAVCQLIFQIAAFVVIVSSRTTAFMVVFISLDLTCNICIIVAAIHSMKVPTAAQSYMELATFEPSDTLEVAQFIINEKGNLV